MASTNPKPVKQLGELLQEQQEPFILEVYLLERGYIKKSLNSEGSLGRSHDNSSKTSKLFKGTPRYSNILKAVFNKLASINKNLKVKHSNHGDRKCGVTEIAEADRFSSSSSPTMFNSCSESDMEEASTTPRKDDNISAIAETFQALNLRNQREKEVATDRKLQRRTIEDSKKLSPVSVLEEVPSDEGYPAHNKTRQRSRTRQEENTPPFNCILRKKAREGSKLSASLLDKTAWHGFRTRQEEHTSPNFILFKKVTEESVLSASLWELLRHSPAELTEPNASTTHYLKSKRVLQQTKQLLFDCVREVVENHGRKERKQQQLPEFLGAEELGKLICEKIMAWGKQCGDETNTTQLLNLDFLSSAEEWSEFETQTGEIAMEIGDAIWEEITNEIVRDMIDNFSTK